MTLAGFIAYAGALAVAAAIPGPGVTALVARALGSGFRPAFAMSLGLILGDLTYLTAVVLGLAFLAQTFGLVFLVIKWLGVAYLAFLAWKFWSTGITPESIEAKKGSTGFDLEFARRPDAHHRQSEDDDLLCRDHPDPRRPARRSRRPIMACLRLVTVLVLMVVLVPYLLLAAKARGLLKSPRGLKF